MESQDGLLSVDHVVQIWREHFLRLIDEFRNYNSWHCLMHRVRPDSLENIKMIQENKYREIAEKYFDEYETQIVWHDSIDGLEVLLKQIALDAKREGKIEGMEEAALIAYDWEVKGVIAKEIRLAKDKL